MNSNNLKVLIESFKQNHPENNTRIGTIYEALQYLSQLEYIRESATTATEISILNYRIKQATDLIQESLIKENTFKWPYNVAPYFTPEETAEFKGYYYEAFSTSYDNRSMARNLQLLKDELRNTNDPEEIARIKAEVDSLAVYSGEAEDFYSEATGTQFEPKSWNKKMINLTTQLKMAEDPDEINMLKQSIIDLGWNPEIEYTTENQIKAIKRIESIYQEKYKNIFTLDLSSLVEASTDTNIIAENFNDNIKPIHVVIVKGDSAFSDVITKYTNSNFSHSAVCIDNDFNKLYSFNLVNGVNKHGGFSIESIEDYPKDGRLAVFSFFVTKDKHEKIRERIKMLADNIDKTAYSVVNILTIPFKNININLSNSMICSQFVDSILKMADVNITGKDSSKVVPNDFYQAGINTKGNIYKVFDGLVKDFKPKKIIAYINKMAKKAKSFTGESSIFDDFIYPTLLEAKLPIQFNKDGDALLTNPFVDFDREYSASHKLLLQYAKTGNTEGMKYELARLYYMNYILERRLYHNKSLKDKEKNIKTRARVLNDFNKYIEYLLKKEPGFNFSEYYENSVFYPHTVEVKSGTLLKLKDIISYIL